jgi:hypothetical protein
VMGATAVFGSGSTIARGVAISVSPRTRIFVATPSAPSLDYPARSGLDLGSLGLWSALFPNFFLEKDCTRCPAPRSRGPVGLAGRGPTPSGVPERLASFLPLEHRSRARTARHALPRSPADRRLRALDSHCPARPRIMASGQACVAPSLPLERLTAGRPPAAGRMPSGQAHARWQRVIVKHRYVGYVARSVARYAIDRSRPSGTV